MHKMIKGRAFAALGGGLVLGLGLLAVGASPAEARPPAHAPAYGYRSHVHSRTCGCPEHHHSDHYDRYDRRGYDPYYSRYDRYDRYSDRYDYRYRSPWGVRRDWDRDGRRNKHDRDRDGDGIRNRRDWDKDGDGVRNRRDDHKRNPRRR